MGERALPLRCVGELPRNDRVEDLEEIVMRHRAAGTAALRRGTEMLYDVVDGFHGGVIMGLGWRRIR